MQVKAAESECMVHALPVPISSFRSSFTIASVLSWCPLGSSTWLYSFLRLALSLGNQKYIILNCPHGFLIKKYGECFCY